MLGETPPSQGAVRRHGNVFLAAEGSHLPFLLPEDQVVVPLHGDKLGKPLPVSQIVRPAQLPGEAVGNADIAGLSLLHHLVQTVQKVIEWCLIVPHVVNVQVHMVHPQVFQTLFQHGPDMLLAGNPCGDLLVGAGEKFGGYHHLVPFGKVPKGPAQVLFAGAGLVGNSGIEKVDPQFQASPDNLPAVCLIHRPAVLSMGGVAKPHAPHADPRDCQIRISQLGIVHICFLLSWFLVLG